MVAARPNAANKILSISPLLSKLAIKEGRTLSDSASLN